MVALLGRVAALTLLVGVAALVLVALLWGAAALLGVAALLRVAALLGMPGRGVALLRRVATLLGRISAPLVGRSRLVRATARLVLRTPVAVVVVLVAGPPLPLAPR